MKMSKLYTKTNRSGKDYDSVNATLLIKGGFIDQTMAGVYSFLPLGLRVLAKIEQIVREEMDKVGREVLLPSLSPTSLWEETGRLMTVDVLLKAVGANELSMKNNDTEYVLNSTHEELMTPISMKFNRSYKDLPAAYYQIQTKFRNEARPKSGILRGREFRMKDLYSFHASEADLKKYYDDMKQVYMRIYERLGLAEGTVITLASGGDFTKEYSHEFQTRCETGEDTVFYDKTINVAYNLEVAPSKKPDKDWGGDLKDMEAVFGENITGMDKLVEYLKLDHDQCVKTLIYLADSNRVLAAAVRGDCDINENKLRKVVNCTSLVLADEATIKRVTGAEMGYAGLIGLADEVEVYVDDALENVVNFECGANKSNYHNINVNWDRDVQKPEKFYDIKTASNGDINPETGEVFEVFRASEVGNIFPLNVKFSKAFSYTYTDKDGKEKPVYMGSYGIGTSRLMGVLVEVFHDDRGIVWPKQVAPFTIHLVSLSGSEERGESLHADLIKGGHEVLWDDRAETPGVKFGDADLIGCPVRLVVSTRNKDKVEWKDRDKEEVVLKSHDEVMADLEEYSNGK